MSKPLIVTIMSVVLLFAATPCLLTAEETVQEKQGLQITISNDDEQGIEASSNGEADDIKQRIKQKVLQIIEKELDGELSDEERTELETGLAELEDELGQLGEIHIGSDSELEPILGIMLGALAITLIFGTPIMIVAAVLYASYRKRRLAHETINQYLASGKEIPEEIMQNLFKTHTASPKSNLHKGMIMIAVGLGILTCFIAMGASEAAYLGLIPLFIGIAQLIIWRAEEGPNGEQA